MSASVDTAPRDNDGGPTANVTVVTPPSSELLVLSMLLFGEVGSVMIASFEAKRRCTLVPVSVDDVKNSEVVVMDLLASPSVKSQCDRLNVVSKVAIENN